MNEREPITHVLKCHPAPFAASIAGVKPYEVRYLLDRDFRVGDDLLLREWNPDRLPSPDDSIWGKEEKLGRIESMGYTGREHRTPPISHILAGGFGLEDGHGVLGLAKLTGNHWSDCAMHNEPAYPAGPCDCGANAPGPDMVPRSKLTWMQEQVTATTAVAMYLKDAAFSNEPWTEATEAGFRALMDKAKHIADNPPSPTAEHDA